MPEQEKTDQPIPADVDEALFMLQADPPVLKKDQSGQVGSQRTKYADLIQANAVILPRLCALGLLWVTAPTIRMLEGTGDKDGPRFVLDWELKHIASGTKRTGAFPLPPNANPMQNGSAITYARRYALVAITNTVAEDEDDDGRGYAGRTGSGMAQRANVRQERSQPVAQRAQPPAPRAERARPVEQPPLPAGRQQSSTERPAAAEERPTTDPNLRYADDGTRLMNKKQLSLLAVLFGKAQVTDRGQKLSLVQDMLGRPVASANEITYDEGRGLLDALNKAIEADPDTAAATVIDIYQRTSGQPQPSARAGARKSARPAETRSVAQQTHDSIMGRPAGPGDLDEPPPWETEPQYLEPPDGGR